MNSVSIPCRVLCMRKIPWVVVIFSVLMLTTLSSCSEDPTAHCYKKVYKKLKKDGHASDRAAMMAKSRCS